MIPQRLAMIAGEDNQGIAALAGDFKRINDTGDLIINQLDHRVIGGGQAGGIAPAGGFRFGQPGLRRLRQNRTLDIEAVGAARRGLKGYPRQLCLLRQIAFAEARRLDSLGVKQLAIGLGRIKRRMRVIDIDARQPGIRPILSDELNRFFGAPGRLMPFSRDPGGIFDKLAKVSPFGFQPIGIIMAAVPVIARRMAVCQYEYPSSARSSMRPYALVKCSLPIRPQT